TRIPPRDDYRWHFYLLGGFCPDIPAVADFPWPRRLRVNALYGFSYVVPGCQIATEHPWARFRGICFGVSYWKYFWPTRRRSSRWPRPPCTLPDLRQLTTRCFVSGLSRTPPSQRAKASRDY